MLCSDIWKQVCGTFGAPWNLVVVLTVLTVLTTTVTPGRCQEEPETAEGESLGDLRERVSPQVIKKS